MITERFVPAAIGFGIRRAAVRGARRVIPLAVALLALCAASAQAHIVAATATCGSVTFDWSRFSSHGSGNGGLNAPEWLIVFKPADGGSTVTMNGQASFAGSSYSSTIAIPSSDGAVTASSSWSWRQTRDGNSNSGSAKLTIADCPVAPVEPSPPTPPPPATSTPATASAVAAPPPAEQPPATATPASPTTHPRVAPTVCVRSHVAMHGLAETARNSVSAYVPARGVKSVTFFIDRRKLVTLTRSSHRRFSIRIGTRSLGLGVHRLTAKVTMLGSSCGTAEVAGRFIHVKPVSLPPRFTG